MFIKMLNGHSSAAMVQRWVTLGQVMRHWTTFRVLDITEFI